MNKVDIVKLAFNLDTPPEVSYGHLADDYQWVDSIGSPPMNKQAWMGMASTMRAAFPDLGFAIDEVHQDGNDVMLTGHFTGTFTNDMDLSAMGMGVLKATGKAVKFPSNTSRVSFTGDKISRNQDLSTGPTAGFSGFLAVMQGG
jgi:predicted ester cyclase